jgi:hypothetical protein
MSTGVAFLIYAFLPSFLLKFSFTRVLLSLLIITGASNYLFRIYNDWMLINGPDYGALILRSLSILLFAIMLQQIFRMRKKTI